MMFLCIGFSRLSTTDGSADDMDIVVFVVFVVPVVGIPVVATTSKRLNLVSPR
jgi:hypothetical protein